MKIVIEEPQGSEEEHVIIKCHQMTPELLHIITLLKMQDGFIGYEGNEIHRIHLAAIYYIEVVENKTFLYFYKKTADKLNDRLKKRYHS